MNFFAALGSSTILSHHGLERERFHPAHQHTAPCDAALTELVRLLIKVPHQKYSLLSTLTQLLDLKFRTNEFWISFSKSAARPREGCHCRGQSHEAPQPALPRAGNASPPHDSSEKGKLNQNPTAMVLF